MKCKTHPDAPHGFDRNASHSEDRYVCECESWEPPVEHFRGATKKVAETCQRCGKENPGDIHTCTPLALRLADELAMLTGTPRSKYTTAQHAAAELIRMHDLLGKANSLARIRAECIKLDTALLRQALEALEACLGWPHVIAALKERLK